jgi:transposase-like protein
MAKVFTVQDFFSRFPDDDKCLDHLMKIRHGNPLDCPNCSKHGQFSRVKKRPVYQCSWCGHQISPMVGTPFMRSSTPLQKWFYAMYLFTTSRHGVPAKELQRQLGVTYKTAWRMGHEIRKYMGMIDGDWPLGGGLTDHVEIDETLIGGRRPRSKGGIQGRSAPHKTIVFGMLERDGDVMTRIVPNVRRNTLEPHIRENVRSKTIISTDELRSYRFLQKAGYRHGAVNHNAEQWVDGIHHTNTIENFWSQLKRSIRGTHTHVSRKHLSKYLGEFEYRYNMRKSPEVMFARLLLSF